MNPVAQPHPNYMGVPPGVLVSKWQCFGNERHNYLATKLIKKAGVVEAIACTGYSGQMKLMW